MRASPHFTPPTPGTPAATPTEASGSGTPATGANSVPGLDVDAVAAALKQATARPVSLMQRDDPSTSPPISRDAVSSAEAPVVAERNELERLYREHNPAKLGDLDALIQKYDCQKHDQVHVLSSADV